MPKVPRITETEWEVMRVVWQSYPITATAVVEQLVARDPSWHPKTVRTLLNRLVTKRALRYSAQGRAYLYEPRVSEAECVSAASESFLQRVFGGAMKPMLAHFIESRRLTRNDLKELQNLLDAEQESPSGTPRRKK